jgi:pimeloyl-ACP methyl ester carboxylesterase
MGNLLDKSTSKFILNDKNYNRLEMDLLLCSGLPKDHFEVQDVNIGQWGKEEVSLRTIICGDQSLPKIVWVHGYCSSGALFYKLIPSFAKKYCIILIDILGMGGSSRVKMYNLDQTPQESIDFFNVMIERWRQSFGNITNFVLAGHSFGGYLVGNYAVKYHQHVKKLLLISPIGIRQPQVDMEVLEKKDTWQEKLHKGGAENSDESPPVWLKPTFDFVWSNKISPFGIGRFMGETQTKGIIERYVNNK